MKHSAYGHIKAFEFNIEIECMSKQCCPKQKCNTGKTFVITKSGQFKLGYGTGLPSLFHIVDGNDYCYSSELFLQNTDFTTEFKCPHCKSKYSIQLK